MTLKHTAKPSHEFKRDLAWWKTYLHTFKDVLYFDYQSKTHVHVDVCNTAAGAFWQGLLPAVSPLHINYKEVAAVVEAVQWWAPYWHEQTVAVHTDST